MTLSACAAFLLSLLLPFFPPALSCLLPITEMREMIPTAIPELLIIKELFCSYFWIKGKKIIAPFFFFPSCSLLLTWYITVAFYIPVPFGVVMIWWDMMNGTAKQVLLSSAGCTWGGHCTPSALLSSPTAAQKGAKRGRLGVTPCTRAILCSILTHIPQLSLLCYFLSHFPLPRSHCLAALNWNVIPDLVFLCKVI